MTAATVTAAIARLDALSRTRALDDRESRQLHKLIVVDRRYKDMRNANVRARTRTPLAAKPATPAASIGERLDAVLEEMRAEEIVRAIYLTADDFAEAHRAEILEQGAAGQPTYRDHPVRLVKGKGRSAIYNCYGAARAVRMRP